MTDVATKPVTPPTPPAPLPAQPDLERQVRVLRRWLVVLTVVVALFVVGGAFLAGAAIFSIGTFGGGGPRVDAEQVKSARQEYEQALGADLGSLDVRAVDVDYGGMAPFPFSLMASKEQALYVEYRLKGSQLLFANVQTQGGDTGLLPTRAPIASQMTDAEFRGIVAAYEAQTKEIFGGVHRYDDSNMVEDGPPASAVSIGGKEYKTKDLWVVVPGIQVKGDTFKPNSFAVAGPSKALVFTEDTSTATFTYLGTDDGSRWTMY